MASKGSTIAAYIRRFRGPPTSREERSREERAQDFWWVDKVSSSVESHGAAQDRRPRLNEAVDDDETNDDDDIDDLAVVSSYERDVRAPSDTAMSMDELSATTDPITSTLPQSPAPPSPPPPPPSSPPPLDDSSFTYSANADYLPHPSSFIATSDNLRSSTGSDHDQSTHRKLDELNRSFWDDLAPKMQSPASSHYADSRRMDVPAAAAIDGLEDDGSFSSSIESAWYAVRPEDVFVEDPEVTIQRLRSRLGLAPSTSTSFASLPLSRAVHSFRSPPLDDYTSPSPLHAPLDVASYVDSVADEVAVQRNHFPLESPPRTTQDVNVAAPLAHDDAESFTPEPPLLASSNETPTPAAKVLAMAPLTHDAPVGPSVDRPAPEDVPFAAGSATSPQALHDTEPVVARAEIPHSIADLVAAPDAATTSQPLPPEPTSYGIADQVAPPQASADVAVVEDQPTTRASPQKPPRRPSVGIAFRSTRSVDLQPGDRVLAAPTEAAPPDAVGQVVESLVSCVVQSWVEEPPPLVEASDSPTPPVPVPQEERQDVAGPDRDEEDEEGSPGTNGSVVDPNDGAVTPTNAAETACNDRGTLVDDDTCEFLDDDVVRMLVHRILLCEEALAILRARKVLHQAVE